MPNRNLKRIRVNNRRSTNPSSVHSTCSSIQDFENFASDDGREPLKTTFESVEAPVSVPEVDKALVQSGDVVVVIRKDNDFEFVERRLDRIYGDDPYLDHILPYEYCAQMLGVGAERAQLSQEDKVSKRGIS
eukprot:937209-Prorocentrum_minimum.AAC.3